MEPRYTHLGGKLTTKNRFLHGPCWLQASLPSSPADK